MIKDIREEIKKEFESLVNEGENIYSIVGKEEVNLKAGKLYILVLDYQKWYTKALNLIKQLIPDRYSEFREHYRLEKKDLKTITYLNYTISDFFLGLRPSSKTQSNQVEIAYNLFRAKFANQLTILQSAGSRIDSLLSNIKGVLQVELFDSELAAAGELLKNGWLRPAGILAGVTLEAHLSRVTEEHDLKSTKKHPAISDYNDLLKGNEVYDVTVWTGIQRLGAIRNLCAHSKGREPTKDEIEELISGVEKAVKTIF